MDEAPARVEDVEIFDGYAAQGVNDEIPKVEARTRILTKKKSKPKRRRMELVREEMIIPDVETASGRRSKRPNRYKF